MWATRLPVWRRSLPSLPHRTHQVRCFASTPSSTPPSSSSSSSSSSTSPSSTSNSSSDSSSSSSSSSSSPFTTLNYIREQNLPLKAKDVAIMRNLTEDERKAYLYYLFVSNKKRANKVMSKPLKAGEEDAINSLENLKPVEMRDPVGEIKDPEEDMEEPDEDADPVKELKKMNPAQIEAQQMEFVANYEINAHLYKLKKNRLLLMDQKEDKSLTLAPTTPPPEFKNIDYDSFASFLQEVDNSFFETNFPFRSDIAPKKKNTDDTMEQRRAITRKRLWDEARILREKHKLFQMLPVRFVVTQGRHVKVTRAGKRQTFSYLVLAGNGRGYGGYGHGKGPSLDVALNKAMLDVRRHLMFVPLHESRTIFNDMVAKCRQTKVLMMSTPRYSGIKGSRLIRAVCEVFGITDITTKVLGRRHVKNTLFAFLNGLSQQTSIRERAIIWGKNVYKMYEPGVYTPRMITEAEILEQSAVVATILNDLSEEHRGDPLRDPMVAIQHNTHLITTLQDRKFGGIGKDGENKLDARTQETKEGEGGEKKDEPSGDGTKKKKRSPSAGRGRGLLKVRKIKRSPFEYPEHPPTPLDR